MRFMVRFDVSDNRCGIYKLATRPLDNGLKVRLGRPVLGYAQPEGMFISDTLRICIKGMRVCRPSQRPHSFLTLLDHGQVVE